MKIIFFGTSHGAPEQNRKCSSTLIEIGENRYIVDMGTQAIEQIITRKIPIESIKSLFITHMHGDHTNGMLSFLELCSCRYLNSNPKIYLPGDTEGTKKAISCWLKCNGTTLRDFDFFHVKEGVLFDDGILRVTAFKNLHIDFSYSFLIEAEGKRVLFSGDLCSEGPSNDFPISVLDTPLDLAICENAHFKATEYLPLFKGNKNLKKLCFNHYSTRLYPSIIEAKEILSKDIEVLIATDDFEIIV